MTEYEILSVRLSIIAILLSILIPFVQFAYNKWFKRLKLDILPFDKLILLFNESGSYLKIKFAINCLNQSITVKNIKATVSKKSNNETNIFNWSFFESVQMNFVTGATPNTIFSTQYATPVRYPADTLNPLIVEFANTDNKTNSDLAETRKKRDIAIQESRSRETGAFDYSTFSEQFKQNSKYLDIYSAYMDCFLWKEGEYDVKITVTYDNDKFYTKSFTFQITKEEEEILKKNIEEVIFCRLKQFYYIPVSFGLISTDMNQKKIERK